MADSTATLDSVPANAQEQKLTIEQALTKAYSHWNAGQAKQAEFLCREVIAAWPDNASALHLLGLIAHSSGQLDLAIEYLRKACQSLVAPGIYFSNLAEMCRQKGMTEEGEIMARRAVARAPALAGAWNNLGIILQETGNYTESLTCLEQAIKLQPNFTHAHNNLGNTLKQMRQLERAHSCYERALALDPSYAEARSNLSHLLKELGELARALAEANEAIKLNPRFADTSMSISAVKDMKLSAATLVQEGKFEEARDILSKIVDVMPGDLATRFDLAEILLMLGEFERGWQEYQYRYSLPHTTHRARKVQLPRWDGRPIPGQTLFIHDEQGFGDTFQFLRMVPWAKERSGARIVLEIHPELLPFAERMGGIDCIIPRGTLPPQIHFHSELMSLPHALGLKTSDLPAAAMPYLKADPARLEHWKKRLEGLPRPLVGLVWGGRLVPNPHRSMPLSTLAPLAMQGITFLSLQKGVQAADALNPPPGMQLINLSDEIANFDDGAAIMSIADLLISIDSAPAHLAGALGRPAWVMLLNIPEWRWSYKGEYSPWYPTLRLFRQPERNDWDSVAKNVATEIARWRDERT